MISYGLWDDKLTLDANRTRGLYAGRPALVQPFEMPLFVDLWVEAARIASLPMMA